MANCMIGFPNLIEQATLIGGDWKTTLPLTNLQQRALGRVARSDSLDLADTQFTVDLGTAKAVRVLGVVAHNISIDGLVRVTASDALDFSSLIYDSGWHEVWPEVYPSESLDWESDNWWSGKYTDEQRSGYTQSYVHIIPEVALTRYWRIEIDDHSGSAGYVQIGRVFIGPAWQPQINLSYGTELGWQTSTRVQEALSGAEYFQRRTPFRVQKFELRWMSLNEALASAFEVQRRAGIDAEVLWIYDPADTVHALRRRFLGRLRELSPIEHPYEQFNRTAFQIKEVL
jgi:hypothetical protein